MKPLVVWVFLCIIWGSTWIFIKIGLDDLPPVTFAATRFLLATILLLPIVLIRGFEFPKGREWYLIVFTGVLQFTFNYALLFWGEQFITSGLAAVLQTTIPAFGLVFARILVPTERITPAKIFAVLLGGAGVAIVFKDQLQLNGSNAFWGSVAVVVGALGAALASVLIKAKGRGIHPASLTLCQMICGLIPLLIYGFAVEGNPLNFAWTRWAIFSVVYLAIVGSIMAFWLYYWLLGKMDVTKAMMISLVTPLIAVVVGAFTRGEKLELQTLIGGALILASVAFIVFLPILRKRIAT
jgi:drug/metabolite transporter (DMT)-like permease